MQPRECRGGVRAIEGDDGAVDEHDLQCQDVVTRASVAQRPRAAGIVADHPADRAAGVGGRVRAEAQTMWFGLFLQVGVDTSGLHPGRLLVRVKVEDRIHMEREVEDDAAADGVAGD